MTKTLAGQINRAGFILPYTSFTGTNYASPAQASFQAITRNLKLSPTFASTQPLCMAVITSLSFLNDAQDGPFSKYLICQVNPPFTRHAPSKMTAGDKPSLNPCARVCVNVSQIAPAAIWAECFNHRGSILQPLP
jgi:hypothetical protein